MEEQKKNVHIAQRLIASILVAALVFSNSVLSFADENVGEPINTGVLVMNNEVFIDGSATTEYTEHNTGPSGSDTNVIPVDISVDETITSYIAVEVYSGDLSTLPEYNNSSADDSYLRVEGNVISEKDSAVVDLDGETLRVVALGDNSSSEDGQREAAVSITGSVSASADASGAENNAIAEAVNGSSSEGNAVSTVIEGTVSAQAESSGGNAGAEAAWMATMDEGSSLEFVAGSDVSASSDAKAAAGASAVEVRASTGAEASTIVGGAVTAKAVSEESEANAVGIHADSNEGGKNVVTVESDVSASVTGDQNSSARALVATSEKGSSTEVRIDGNVSAETEASEAENSDDYVYVFDPTDYSLYLDDSIHDSFAYYTTGVIAAASDASTTVGVGGNVSASGRDSTIGVAAVTDGEASDIDITVLGNVSSVGLPAPSAADEADDTLAESRQLEYFSNSALSLVNGGGTIDVTVNGSVSAKGGEHAAGIVVASSPEYAEEVKNGTSSVSVFAENGGGVSSDDVAIAVRLSENQTANILVDGTVEGVNAAVLVNEEAIVGENLTLTVWEILPDQDGNLVTTETTETDERGWEVPVRYQNTAAEEKIQYIIRIDPDSSKYIETDLKKDENGYLLAHQDDKVLLKLNVSSGYEISEVNGAKGEIVRDESGQYYLVVPRGGGVLLSVTLAGKAGTESGSKDGTGTDSKTSTGTGSTANNQDSNKPKDLLTIGSPVSAERAAADAVNDRFAYRYTNDGTYATYRNSRKNIDFWKKDDDLTNQRQLYHLTSGSKSDRFKYYGICQLSAGITLVNRYIAYYYNDYSSPYSVEDGFKAVGYEKLPTQIIFKKIDKDNHIGQKLTIKSGTDPNTLAEYREGYLYEGSTREISKFTYNDGLKKHKINSTKLKVTSTENSKYRTPEGLAELLREHPEGIYVHAKKSNAEHAFVISKYSLNEDGSYTFTILDPSNPSSNNQYGGGVKYDLKIPGTYQYQVKDKTTGKYKTITVKNRISKTSNLTINQIDAVRFFKAP